MEKKKHCLQILFFPALALNLLKGFFERSKISFNRFRTSAKEDQYFSNALRMQMLLVFVFCCNLSFSDQELSNLDQHEDDSTHEDLVPESQRLIDVIFENARTSIEDREDLMTEEWLTKQKEIMDLRNLISDAHIISFDTQTANSISECLAPYIIQKTNEELLQIFGIDGISSKRIKDFYAFSHMMCKLSGGLHCGRMIRTVESDNLDKMLLLKAQKTARKHIRKEKAQQLTDALIFGMHR